MNELLDEITEKKISKYRVAKELGLTVQAVQNWFKRNTVPKKHENKLKKFLAA